MPEEIKEKTKEIHLRAGEKCSICTCGKSKNLPYCDNEHKKLNEEKGTNYKSLKIVSKQDTDIFVHSKIWDENK